MTRDELLTRVNSFAAGLGAMPVSSRRLSDLIDEEIVRGPTPIGQGRGKRPDWRWSESTATTVEAIVELGLDGIKRSNLLAIYLYVLGHDVPAERVLLGLAQEAKRNMKQIRRMMPDADMKSMSPRARATFLRQMADVDPRLAAIGGEEFAKLNAEFMRSSVWGGSGDLELFAALFGDDFKLDEHADARELTTVIHGMGGIFGEREENDSTALDSIKVARPDELEEARQRTLVILLLAIGSNAAAARLEMKSGLDLLRTLSGTLTSPPWLVWLFTLNLNGIIKLRDK